MHGAMKAFFHAEYVSKIQKIKHLLNGPEPLAQSKIILYPLGTDLFEKIFVYGTDIIFGCLE